jgi:hypothetical protein
MPSPQRGSALLPHVSDPPSKQIGYARLEGSQSFVEGPRIASTIDLPDENSVFSHLTGSKPRLSAQSLRGHTSCEAEGFPRRYPLFKVSSLHDTDS